MNMEINPSEYKVLIVDDVISNVLLLKVLLTNEKFKIVTAGNGTQALEQVKKENPDLVLLYFGFSGCPFVSTDLGVSVADWLYLVLPCAWVSSFYVFISILF